MEAQPLFEELRGRNLIRPESMKRACARIEEAMGLLSMLKPFLKRRGLLTPAEQDVFVNVLDQVGSMLLKERSAIHEELWKPRTAIRKAQEG